MKKILKRNQLIILVISLMLITAGYLNFTANNSMETAIPIAEREDSTIGDAQLVTANINEEKETNEINRTEANQETKEQENSETEETMLEVSEKDDNYYFEKSKLERNSMYSKLLETYQEIYNNVNSSNEQKKDAIDKITKINNTKNSIMIAENLIIAKGFENLVIFVNDDSISVVVKGDALEGEKVAQIQNIISRELNVEADKIHISNK